MTRCNVASSMIVVDGGNSNCCCPVGDGDGLTERRCCRLRDLACGERYLMGGASIPWSRSERRWSASDAASVADADAGVAGGASASLVAAASSAGVAADSEGFEMLQVGSQDMWARSLGKKINQRESVPG